MKVPETSHDIKSKHTAEKVQTSPPNFIYFKCKMKRSLMNLPAKNEISMVILLGLAHFQLQFCGFKCTECLRVEGLRLFCLNQFS